MNIVVYISVHYPSSKQWNIKESDNELTTKCKDCKYRNGELCNYYKTMRGFARWRYVVARICDKPNRPEPKRKKKQYDFIFQEPEYMEKGGAFIKKIFGVANKTEYKQKFSEEEIEMIKNYNNAPLFLAALFGVTNYEISNKRSELKATGQIGGKAYKRPTFTPEQDLEILDESNAPIDLAAKFGVLGRDISTRRWKLKNKKIRGRKNIIKNRKNNK